MRNRCTRITGVAEQKPVTASRRNGDPWHLLSRQRYKLADNQLARTSGVLGQTNDRSGRAARKIFGN